MPSEGSAGTLKMGGSGRGVSHVAEREVRMGRRQKGIATAQGMFFTGGLAGLILVGMGLPPTPQAFEGLAQPEGFDVPAPVLLLTPSAERARDPESIPDLEGTIRQYCVACHNSFLQTANLALDSVDFTDPGADPDTWERVITRLRTGTMPPTGIPRPDMDTYRQISEWLESELDKAWQASPNPGRISAVHRLNRTEYNNAIRDLLALDVDVRDLLPGDETTEGGFDNVADALTISTAHLERYMSVARQVTRLATGLPPEAPGVEIFRADDLIRQEDRVSEDLPLGSRGGLAVRHHFPADGEYEISITLAVNYADYVKGMGWEQELDVRLDGGLLDRFQIGGGARQFRHTPDTFGGGGSGPGWPGSPEWEEYMQFGAQEGLEVRARVEAGPRVIGVSFPRDHWEPEDLARQPPLRLWGQAGKNTHDYMLHAGVMEVRVAGPYQASGIAENTPSRRAIFICEPDSPSEEEACASRILTRMARMAFRRPIQSAEQGEFLRFFRLGREDGRSFEAGIQFGLERILSDPDFILRVYRDPAAQVSSAGESEFAGIYRRVSSDLVAPRQGIADPYALSPLEVASRLSFFLWGSVPDERLLGLAEEGSLTEVDVLGMEVERMLADPRGPRALVDGFASQWLMLRILGEITSHERIYPDFEHNLRNAMRRETELFVESTIREDRSVLDLLGADYTYLNERLARHYGIPNVYGSHFRRVQVPDLSQRGGILAHASILTVSSYPDRTTPVLRGKWLLENILGLHVPEPPEDIDTSLQEDDESTAGVTSIRERLARHRDDPSCSSCHALIDPLGFALESYDALGGWRTIDERGNPVDNVGLWPTGVELEGFEGLRSLLLNEQAELFVRALTEKLMAFALGRTIEYYDRPVIRQIVRDAAADDYRWSALLRGVVESPQFLMRARAADEERARSAVSGQ
jgi:mono/diheme cytochrome c family protein